MSFPRLKFRSPIGIAAIAAFSIGASGAGAATLQRLAVTQTTGSLGATAFVQPSATSAALQGEVAASANTSIKLPFGVLGEYDAAGSTFGVGVIGLSSTGYAVGAEAFGSSPAILGLGEGTSNGLEAGSVGSAAAIVAEATGTGVGIVAQGDNSDGILGMSFTNETAGIIGEDSAPQLGTGVLGEDTSPGGSGVTGTSQTGSGVVGEADSGGSAAPVLAGTTLTPGTDLIQGDVLKETASGISINQTFSAGSSSANASGSVITASGASGDVQANGDVYISGKIYSQCTALFPAKAANCTTTSGLASVSRSNNGSMLTTYASRHASATMEDEGEAQLVNGAAHVALDPGFASMIATAQPYLVFTTPRGDSRGLYVTHVTPSGFDVRESSAGRSTLAFDYRIVAHPYGDRSQRLAVVAPTAARPLHATTSATISGLARLIEAHAKIKTAKRPMPKSFASLVK